MIVFGPVVTRAARGWAPGRCVSSRGHTCCTWVGARSLCVVLWSHVVTWSTARGRCVQSCCDMDTVPVTVRTGITGSHVVTPDTAPQSLHTQCSRGHGVELPCAWPPRGHAEMVSGRWGCRCHGNLSGCFCTLARDLQGLLAPLVSSSLVFLIQGPALLSRSLGLGVREGNGTPLQYSCLENPMDGGAGKAGVHGVAEGRTRLSNFTFTFHPRNSHGDLTSLAPHKRLPDASSRRADTRLGEVSSALQ